LGVELVDPVLDSLLVSRCVCFLERSGAAYDDFFFDWYGGAASEARATEGPRAGVYRGEGWSAAKRALFERAPTSAHRLASAYFGRDAPCSFLIDEVEAIWKPIAEGDDWSRFEAKVADVRSMARLFDRGP